MLFNDFLNILGGNAALEGSLGIYYNDGTECAKTEATGLNELYFLCESASLDMLFKFCLNGFTARRGTACTATDKHMCTNHILLTSKSIL